MKRRTLKDEEYLLVDKRILPITDEKHNPVYKNLSELLEERGIDFDARCKLAAPTVQSESEIATMYLDYVRYLSDSYYSSLDNPGRTPFMNMVNMGMVPLVILPSFKAILHSDLREILVTTAKKAGAQIYTCRVLNPKGEGANIPGTDVWVSRLWLAEKMGREVRDIKFNDAVNYIIGLLLQEG